MAESIEKISVQCECGARLKAPAAAFGLTAKCPKCKRVLVVGRAVGDHAGEIRAAAPDVQSIAPPSNTPTPMTPPAITPRPIAPPPIAEPPALHLSATMTRPIRSQAESGAIAPDLLHAHPHPLPEGEGMAEREPPTTPAARPAAPKPVIQRQPIFKPKPMPEPGPDVTTSPVDVPVPADEPESISDDGSIHEPGSISDEEAVHESTDDLTDGAADEAIDGALHEVHAIDEPQSLGEPQSADDFAAEMLGDEEPQAVADEDSLQAVAGDDDALQAVATDDDAPQAVAVDEPVDEPAPARSLVVGVFLSAVGSLVGAGIWFAVAWFAGREWSLVGLAVGLFAGLGMWIGRPRAGRAPGAVAAVMALGGLLLAKIAVFVFISVPTFGILALLAQGHLRDQSIEPHAATPQQSRAAEASALLQWNRTEGALRQEQVRKFWDSNGGPLGPIRAMGPEASARLFLRTMFVPMDALSAALATVAAFRIGTLGNSGGNAGGSRSKRGA